ncbi:MAG TPA: SPOR domain-containing protein [Gammaproteobacteria bacterium]|nr:SPOR domain-containing protein [Gammaproteobacteria bacterium]
MRRWLMFVVLALLPSILLAAPAAVVEGLQMPAWLERDGARSALRPGMELKGSDQLHTGAGARVLLSLEEGSHVKLGENADLQLGTLQPPADAQGIYKGVLEVLKGAFRFTTSALGKHRQRDITARIATITIGIRGTDVWGKAQPDRDFAVLLEGKITIQREGEPEQTMSAPMSLFMAPRGQPALPIGPVNPDDLKRWAQETELQKGQGILLAGGHYALRVAQYRYAASAEAIVRQLTEAGYTSAAQPRRRGGADWREVVMPGFATRPDAEHVAGQLKEAFHFTHIEIIENTPQ